VNTWCGQRHFAKLSAARHAKVVLVLYDDPKGGYPKSYARDELPVITHYPDQFGKPGQTTPTPTKSQVPQDLQQPGHRDQHQQASCCSISCVSWRWVQPVA